MKYDFLIVGAGIFGATCARLLTDKGYKCLILERKGYVGGLCSDIVNNHIVVNRFGPHVLYTDNQEVWDFVNKYSKFNEYKHFENIVKDDMIFRVPIDMLTINKLFKKTTSLGAFKQLNTEIKNYNVLKATTLEDSIIMSSGTTIYGYLLKNLYEKKLGISCAYLLPNTMPFLMPISVKHESTMYNTRWQGFPKEGYTKMIENIIGDDIDIMLNKDFVKDIDKYLNIANIILYTGAIDELCHYMYGPLKWQSAKFVQIDESLRGNYIYGCAVTNVENPKDELYRIIEHKWFTPENIGNQDFDKTNIVTYEYPKKWEPGDELLYSINDEESMELHKRYCEYIYDKYPNMVLCGKNGAYDNFTISYSIEAALTICKSIEEKKENEN